MTKRLSSMSSPMKALSTLHGVVGGKGGDHYDPRSPMEMNKMKQTKHGLFHYEHNGYTPTESPDENTFYVYLDDEGIGEITLSYTTSKSYSNRYGWTDVRGERSDWAFCQFDHDVLPHDGEHPSSAINMSFAADEFHNIKGAFKRCVELICQHLDSLLPKDHTKKWTTWEQTIVWNYCPECSISWHLGDEPTCTCGDEVVA